MSYLVYEGLSLGFISQETKHLMPLGDTAKEMGDLHFLGCHLPPLVCEGIYKCERYVRYLDALGTRRSCSIAYVGVVCFFCAPFHSWQDSVLALPP